MVDTTLLAGTVGATKMEGRREKTVGNHIVLVRECSGLLFNTFTVTHAGTSVCLQTDVSQMR